MTKLLDNSLLIKVDDIDNQHKLIYIKREDRKVANVFRTQTLGG